MARRELASYFVSPAAYVVSIVFCFLATAAFWALLQGYIQQSLAAQMLGSRPTITEGVLRPFFAGALFRGLYLVGPLISMRLLSEDRRQGTLDLLLTSPIRTLQVVLGKYLGALGFFALLLALTLHIPALLVWRGGADIGVAVVGYTGIFLVGALFLAAGVFASSLTENQIVSALLAYALVTVVYLIGLVAEASTRFLGGVLTPFSLGANLEDFFWGVLDSAAVVYFISMSAFFIFLTQRVIDSRRWR
jgi:ABC-2 type transport system permease protein